MENNTWREVMKGRGLGKAINTSWYSHFGMIGDEEGEIQLYYNEGPEYVVGTYAQDKIFFNDEGEIIEAIPKKILVRIPLEEYIGKIKPSKLNEKYIGEIKNIEEKLN